MKNCEEEKKKKPLLESVWEDFEIAFGLIAEANKNEKEPR